MKAEHEILAKLPKSRGFIFTSPAAHAIYSLLQRGEDPITVIDEMMCHYEKVNTHLMDELKRIESLSKR